MTAAAAVEATTTFFYFYSFIYLFFFFAETRSPPPSLDPRARRTFTRSKHYHNRRTPPLGSQLFNCYNIFLTCSPYGCTVTHTLNVTRVDARHYGMMFPNALFAHIDERSSKCDYDVYGTYAIVTSMDNAPSRASVVRLNTRPAATRPVTPDIDRTSNAVSAGRGRRRVAAHASSNRRRDRAGFCPLGVV